MGRNDYPVLESIPTNTAACVHSDGTCGRCRAAVGAGDEEHCWYCLGHLCVTCWDGHGHCGHPEASAFLQRTARTPAAMVG